jgi:hypothetical protein
MPLQESRGAQYDHGLQDQIGAILIAAANDARRGVPIDAAARARIRDVCAAARNQGVRAEQLIIAVKRRWWSPNAETIALRDTEGLLARVVTLCIQEYYALDGVATNGNSQLSHT